MQGHTRGHSVKSVKISSNRNVTEYFLTKGYRAFEPVVSACGKFVKNK